MKLHEHRNGEWTVEERGAYSRSVESTPDGLIVRTVEPVGSQNYDVEVEIPWTVLLKLIEERVESRG